MAVKKVCIGSVGIAEVGQQCVLDGVKVQVLDIGRVEVAGKPGIIVRLKGGGVYRAQLSQNTRILSER